MRILSTLILITTLVLATGCNKDFICFDIYGNPTDCTEQNLITVSTSTEPETQARQVNCQNAGFGYSIGQPASGAIATIQVDSVYCDSTSTARVAAQFYPPNNTIASWYDVEWQYLSDTTSGQFVDYVLPVDSLGLSLYYTLKVIAQPNATHANPNSMTIVATDSYF